MIASEITAVILAGGLGTRLRSEVADRPKALAQVSGKPFLEIILGQLEKFSIRKAVICVGYMGEQIESQYGSSFQSIEISYSHERSLLGTGGAMRYALDLVKTVLILGLNGDSFCDYNLSEFITFHKQKNARASLLLSPATDVSAFGSVALNEDNQITSFIEKSAAAGTGLVNAGVYLIDPLLLREIQPGRVFSLEKDIFPGWVGRDFYGYPSSSNLFIDIGTPKSYRQAQNIFSEKVTP
jgi:NDP-sugar pyrophosphorylase family protein